MVARPTTSMKKGQLYRTSCDEKNHEIEPVMIQWWWSSNDDPDRVMIQTQWWWPMMIQIDWWSRSSDDVQWWSRSSDGLDLVMMMIQIKWWSRFSDDDPDRVMIQNRWWRWLEDEDDKNSMMIQMIQRRILVLIYCVEKNTFLVKRECWCICNFRMYFTCISYIL